MSEKRGVNIKALFLGALASLGTSLVTGFIVGVIYALVLIAQGVHPDKIEPFMIGTNFLVVGLNLGFVCTTLGGYIAGRISQHAEVLHGGLVGGVLIVTGLLSIAFYPMWFSIVSFIGLVPSGMAGGLLASRSRQRTPEDGLAEPTTA